jgi:signal transduction histidine kinase
LIGALAIEHLEANRFTEWQARLVEAFADHCAVAIENARLFEQSRQLAVFSERRRLAAELHDSVSQSLYGISLGAHTILSILESEPDRVRQVLNHVLNLAEAAFSDMRTLIFELRPEALQSYGLVTALSRQADILRRNHEIQVHLALGSEPKMVSADTKEVLYRIAQESMNNIVKHARATEVCLKLSQEAGALCLTVHDNGGGFDPMLDYAGHLGLRVMRERVEGCHGTLEIMSTPSEGTTVRARVPIQS